MLKFVVPLLSKQFLHLHLTSLVDGFEHTAMILLRFFDSDRRGTVKLGFAGLTGRYASQDEAVSLGPLLVLDDSPELCISETTALAWVWVNASKNPEAIIPFMIFSKSKLSQCDSHNVLARVAVGNLDNLGDTTSRNDANNILTLR